MKKIIQEHTLLFAIASIGMVASVINSGYKMVGLEKASADPTTVVTVTNATVAIVEAWWEANGGAIKAAAAVAISTWWF